MSKTIKIDSTDEIPENYTGVVEYPYGDKVWLVNVLNHRKNGPAVKDKSGYKEYWYKGRLLDFGKIKQLIYLDYPEKTAIKLAYFILMNKNHEDNKSKKHK